MHAVQPQDYQRRGNGVQAEGQQVICQRDRADKENTEQADQQEAVVVTGGKLALTIDVRRP
ncbi:hypothetical protein D3C76_1608510 [compost metagenome]